MHLLPDEMASFCDELEKVALPKGLLPTALTGAAAGGLWQGGSAYEQARAEGAGRLSALGSAAKSGLVGAAGGAAVGGALVGAAHIPGRIGNFAGNTAKSVETYGRNQLHVVTGKGRLSDFGEGVARTGPALEAAKKSLTEMSAKQPVAGTGVVDRVKNWNLQRKVRGAEKDVAGAQVAHNATQVAENKELTSIPGFAKSLVKDPKGTIKDTLNYQWHSMPTAGKVMMAGVPLAMGVHSAVQGDAEGAGQSAGMAASSMLPFANPVGSMSMMMGPWGRYAPTSLAARPLEAAGRGIGNAIGRIVRKDEQQ